MRERFLVKPAVFSGISLKEPYLRRESVVRALLQFFCETKEKFCVLGSPPATGKTSILIILIDLLTTDERNLVLYFAASNLESPGTCARRFHSETGINLDAMADTQRKLKDQLGESRTLWLLVDEALCLYSSDAGFWQRLVKQSNLWMPQNAHCLIATTYSQSIGTSPVPLKMLPHFPRDRGIMATHEDPPSSESGSLRLTDAEMETFWDMTSKNKAWSKLQSVKHALKKMSSGNIGVLAVGMSFVGNHLHLPPKQEKSEQTVHSALYTRTFMDALERCFFEPEGFPVSAQDALSWLILRSRNGEEVDITLPQYNHAFVEGQEQPIFNLWRCGVLTTSGAFTSQAAHLFYYARLFPGRAMSISFTSLDELAIQCVASLSATSLQYARDGVHNYPKEGAIQHLFNEALNRKLPAEIAVVPELTTYLTDAATGKTTESGEIDFFVQRMNYKIELRRLGKRIGEHIDRFNAQTGCYRELPDIDKQSSILVIDFRGDIKKPCPKDPLRCTLYFSDDFAKCQIQMREEDNRVVVSLQK